MDICPSHTLDGTNWIEITLSTYIDVHGRKCSRQEPYSYLTLYLSLSPNLFSLLRIGAHVVITSYVYTLSMFLLLLTLSALTVEWRLISHVPDIQEGVTY